MKILYAISLFFLLGVITPAGATVYNVPGDYLSIQMAINASVRGDTVLVEPGTYNENIDFDGKDILVGSRFVLTGDTTYVSQTIISTYSGPLVEFRRNESRDARLSGFTITGGHAHEGAGISCYESSPTLDNLRIVGNTAQLAGGGIHINHGDPLVIACVISDNTADNWAGGGIACFYSAVVVDGNIIEGNYAGESGGGIFSENSAPEITNNRIVGNEAVGYYGGGIGSRNSTPIIADNYISDNDGGQYGGGLFY